MITQMQRMDVVTNNIANTDTTGYKKDQVASQSFTDELARRLNDPGLRLFQNRGVGPMGQGVFIDDVYTDFSTGSLRQTGGSLDIAINGHGFFCVDVNGEELYTRDGSFVLRADGALITKDGGLVQGQNGMINLPNGSITIDETGRIIVGDQYVDTLRVTAFTDNHTLRKLHDNYYRTIGSSQMAPFTGLLTQGFLENSNVNSVKEMVEMIALSRAYETNARMISIHDQTMNRAVNDIARR
jgi:flagellar basal-body rod protein FlgG